MVYFNSGSYYFIDVLGGIYIHVENVEPSPFGVIVRGTFFVRKQHRPRRFIAYQYFYKDNAFIDINYNSCVYSISALENSI